MEGSCCRRGGLIRVPFPQLLGTLIKRRRLGLPTRRFPAHGPIDMRKTSCQEISWRHCRVLLTELHCKGDGVCCPCPLQKTALRPSDKNFRRRRSIMSLLDRMLEKVFAGHKGSRGNRKSPSRKQNRRLTVEHMENRVMMSANAIGNAAHHLGRPAFRPRPRASLRIEHVRTGTHERPARQRRLTRGGRALRGVIPRCTSHAPRSCAVAHVSPAGLIDHDRDGCPTIASITSSEVSQRELPARVGRPLLRIEGQIQHASHVCVSRT